MPSSSGKGTTTITQNPPQLLPEGRPGYLRANQFYQDILENPPAYEGPRVAPQTAGQTGYIGQTYDYFGTPQPGQKAAEAETYKTTTGGYLPTSLEGNPRLSSITNYDVTNPTAGYAEVINQGTGTMRGIFARDRGLGDISVDPITIDPFTMNSSGIGNLGSVNAAKAQTVAAPKANYSEKTGPQWTQPDDKDIQQYVSSAQEPYLRRLEEDTLQQITSDFGLAGGGVANERELVSKFGAMDRTTEIIAKDVIAPIKIRMEELEQAMVNSERERMAAIASGDADRVTRASQTTASLQAQLDGEAMRLSQAGNIAAAELAAQRAISEAGLRSQHALTSAELRSRHALGGAQLRNQRDIAGAELASQRDIAEAGLLTDRDLAAAGIGAQGATEAMRAGENRRLTAATLGSQAYEDERQRMFAAPQQEAQNLQNELLRTGALRLAGDYEQGYDQRLIDEARAIFEEPLYRQDRAAGALASMAGAGPGGSTTAMDQSSSDIMGDIQGLAATAAMVALLAGKAGGSSSMLKDNIEPIKDKQEIVRSVLGVDVKQWRYKTDVSDRRRIGGILEEMPDFMRNDELTLDIVSIIGSMMLTIQHLHERIKELENVHSY